MDKNAKKINYGAILKDLGFDPEEFEVIESRSLEFNF
jgi:hypothetical protein